MSAAPCTTCIRSSSSSAVSLRAELNALQNPQDTPRMIAELEDAKAKADEFRGRSARWQVTLTDGITDLIADMEHDLRDRLRTVQREAEQAIDEGDPGPIWEQISEWIDQRSTAAITETFVWTDERSRWLSEEVADLFSQDESAIPAIDVGSTEGLLDPVDPISGMDSGAMSAGEKIFIGVRGSYGGVLMVGLATGLIGMALINPLSLLAGILVGRRAYREDMQARLSRRQQEAKLLVRRYIDEVIFQVGKQLKDRLRLVQRTARDHFGSMADELHRSLSEALTSAKAAAGSYTATRDERVIALQEKVARLDSIRQVIPVLPPTPARQAPSGSAAHAAGGAQPGRCRNPPCRRDRPMTNDVIADADSVLAAAAERIPARRGRTRRDRSAAHPAERTAAARDRRHGQGGKIHAAERDARRADRPHRHRRVHQDRDLVPVQRNADDHHASPSWRTAAHAHPTRRRQAGPHTRRAHR